MFRHFNVEAFVFWWINSVMAIYALLWVAKKIADFLEHRDKLRKKLDWPSGLFISTACLAT